MERELKGILSLRADIEALNIRSKLSLEKLEHSFDFKNLRNLVETLKKTKSLLEQKQKFLELVDGVRKMYDFHDICQTNLESSSGESEVYQQALRATLKGAKSAFTTKLDEYLDKLPILAVEEARDHIKEIKISDKDRRTGKEFTDDEIFSHIEYFIKILPDNQLCTVSDVASHESRTALKLLAKTFQVASRIVSPDTSPEDFKILREAKMSDIEVLLKDARRTLEHERYMKETQQSKGRQTTDLILTKQIPIMKSILYQVSMWFDELLKVYEANLQLKSNLKVEEVQELIRQ